MVEPPGKLGKELSMNKTLTTPIGEFTAQIDLVLGKKMADSYRVKGAKEI